MKSTKIDELAQLVHDRGMSGDRTHAHIEHIERSQLVPLHRVHQHLPLTRATILQWERAGIIRVYRPNSRRSYVHIDDLMRAWQQCADGHNAA